MINKEIKLKKFTETDFPALISWIHSEEELIQFAGSRFDFPLSEEQLIKYISDPNINPFKIIYDKKYIGHAEIFKLDGNPPKLCRILIGDQNYRGKGLCPKIASALLKICKETYNSTQVELNVFDWNSSAIKCYEKVGFKFNKEKTKEFTVNEKNWISVNMFVEI